MTRLPDNFADLVEHWTLLPAETNLLAGKHEGVTKLGFALLLKFYGRYGRFPRGRAELKSEAVEFVASQVKASAADLGFYEWDGPTIKRHRAEIRRFFGFREFTVADGDKLTDRLAGDYAQRVRQRELVREQFLSECRTRQVEPPTPKRTDRIVGGALARIGLRAEKKVMKQMVTGRTDSTAVREARVRDGFAKVFAAMGKGPSAMGWLAWLWATRAIPSGVLCPCRRSVPSYRSACPPSRNHPVRGCRRGARSLCERARQGRWHPCSGRSRHCNRRSH